MLLNRTFVSIRDVVSVCAPRAAAFHAWPAGSLCALKSLLPPFASASQPLIESLWHLPQATVELQAGDLAAALADECADAFYPALGYLCGLKSEARVPVRRTAA